MTRKTSKATEPTLRFWRPGFSWRSAERVIVHAVRRGQAQGWSLAELCYRGTRTVLGAFARDEERWYRLQRVTGPGPERVRYRRSPGSDVVQFYRGSRRGSYLLLVHLTAGTRRQLGLTGNDGYVKLVRCKTPRGA